MNPLFEVSNLSVAYGDNLVLKNISVKLDSGKLIAIIGPNGAGKSTFLKAILGFVPRLTGVIKAFKETYKGSDSRIAYIPQREVVDWDFPLSVYELVMMGTYGRLGWFKSSGPKEKALVLDCIEQVNLMDFKDRQIGELSGGQQQRAFLARALAQQADIYFMDEPFSGVDKPTEGAIIEILRELKNEGKTIVAVHHNLYTVKQYFDEVILIKQRLVASGTVDEVLTSQNLESTYGEPLLNV